MKLIPNIVKEVFRKVNVKLPPQPKIGEGQGDGANSGGTSIACLLLTETNQCQ